jgi:1-phosphatidylinositol phosphodiesterase
MSTIKDETPIWALTIPGTHDTCARFGGDLVICQSLELPAQLEAGIRFLDIRTRHFNNSLPIHHGLVFQNKSFTSVMEDVTNFLRQHSTEFVFVQVQREYESAGNTTEFDALIHSVCDSFKDFLAPGGADGVLDPRSTTLGSVRGKLCIIQSYDGMSVPGSMKRWDCVDQNDWEMEWGDIESKKIPRIKEHFERVKGMDGCIRRNWLSAASASSWPHAVAKLTNQAGLDCLKGHECCRNGLGIIIADFPGSELIEHCIRHSRETASHF